jgi:small GTP-binding protein
MSDIFISYRRKDSAHDAKRIYEWLAAHFGAGSVFMDLSGIEPGENFRTAIRREIDSASVMLVIIGKQWTFAENSDGLQRLEEANDVVRREIVIALENGIRVVPVLVSGAQIPRTAQLPAALARLTKLNAFAVSEQAFEDEMASLAEYIRRWLAEQSTTTPLRAGEPQLEPGSHQAPPMIIKKVCMLGSEGVGKTSLVSRFVSSMFSEKYHTTISVKIDRKVIILGDAELTMMLWDLAGEDAFHKVSTTHLRNASGLIVVVDGRNSTLRTAPDLVERARNEVGPVPIVLAANKIDLCRESWSWEYTLETLDEISDNLRVTPFTTSAKTGTGVELMFSHLGRQMLKGPKSL